MTLDDSYLSSLSLLRNARLRSESRAYRSEAGARLVERWAFYFARETVAAVNDLWRTGLIFI
jgi:hypothetical protein